VRFLPPTLALLAACGTAPGNTTPSPSECDGSLEAVTARDDPSIGEAVPAATVVSVVIRGVRSVPERLVREAIELEPGTLLSAPPVRADIRRILALRVFEDVRVHAEPVTGGVRVTYEVVERPLVRSAVLLGDGGEAARHRVEGLTGEVFQPGRLSRLAQKITADRQRDGYAEASTRVSAGRSEAGVAVCVHAEPGRRWVIDELTLEGNEAIDDEALLGAMTTLDGRVNAEGGVYRADLFEDDRARMLALYYDVGRVMARVQEPQTRWEDDALVVTIAITEGEVFRLGELRVSGDLEGPASEYLAILALEEGMVFERSAVAAAIDRVRERDRERQIGVAPVTQIDAERRVIDLEIQITDYATPEAPPPDAEDVEIQLTDQELSLDPSLAPEESP
jgi:outer membrane protein insertion porin family